MKTILFLAITGFLIAASANMSEGQRQDPNLASTANEAFVANVTNLAASESNCRCLEGRNGDHINTQTAVRAGDGSVRGRTEEGVR